MDVVEGHAWDVADGPDAHCPSLQESRYAWVVVVHPRVAVAKLLYLVGQSFNMIS
jgi:hypothetical protein